MAEAHQVSLSSGETGPDAPNQTVPETSNLGAHGISIPTGPEEVAETPIGEEPVGDRPDWLPEKFESPEALAKAYSSLEARMGTQPAPEASEAPEAAEPTESTGVSTEALQPFYDEYSETGELAEESFAALEQMGLSRDLVSSFMAGQRASHEAELNKIYGEVGGPEAYQAALGWAVQAMSPEEIQAFNEQVETGDYATAMVDVRGLMAMHAQSGHAGVNAPQLLQTEPVGTGGAIYESLEQVMSDMKSPEYKNDPAFRAKVQQKISRSQVM